MLQPNEVAVQLTLFAWSFLAATILPLGSEPVLIAAILGGHPVWPSVAVATLGNVLGSCTTYWLAYRAVIALDRRGTRPFDASRAARLVRRFGQPSIVLAWVPIIGDALVAIAGAVRMPFLPFLVWLTAGKAARYVAIAWGAKQWG